MSKPVVLVIDDSDIARHAVCTMLRRADYVVRDLPSAIGSTREILRHQVSAVVVDLDMPGLRGDKLATLLRTNPRLSEVVLILISGQSQDELAALREDRAINAVIAKSDLELKLVATLGRLLSSGRSDPKPSS